MRREYDKYHLLNVFCAVIDNNSFSKAAVQLNMSASGVSKAVSQLEENYGQVLINRTTRAMAMTDAGNLVYNQGYSIINAFRAIEDSVSEVGDLGKGKLRITFPNTLGRMVFSQICIDFQKAYPGFSLELIFTATHLDLIEDDIDIAFRSWNTLKNSQFYALELLELSLIFVASPAYIALHGKPESLDQLCSHNMLLTRNRRLEDSWELDTKHYRFKGNLICNNRFHVREAVLAGNGIAMQPSYFCQRDLNAGTMVELLPDLERPKYHLGALYKAKRETSKKVDVFLEFVQLKIAELAS